MLPTRFSILSPAEHATSNRVILLTPCRICVYKSVAFTPLLLFPSFLFFIFVTQFFSLFFSLLFSFFVRLRVQSRPLPSSSRGVNAKKQNERIESKRSIGGEQSVVARITSAKWCYTPSSCLVKRINLPSNFQYIVSFDSISLRFFSFLFLSFSTFFVPFRVYYFSRLLEIIKKYISLPRHPRFVVFLSAVTTSRDQGHAPCSQTCRGSTDKS